MREIWLSSEDTGAWGRDIGSSLPELLCALVAVLPAEGRTMLRIGMTNPVSRSKLCISSFLLLLGFNNRRCWTRWWRRYQLTGAPCCALE